MRVERTATTPARALLLCALKLHGAPPGALLRRDQWQKPQSLYPGTFHDQDQDENESED
jgi:hypothetical protein